MDQQVVFDAMLRAETYPHPVGTLAARETHISKVFLVDPWVYKIKKAVDVGFLDYSTLKQRRYYCQREVTLNQRLAGGVYHKVVTLNQDGDRIAVQGPGRVVEYAVCMRLLPDADSLLRRLHAGRAREADMDDLALTLHRFYKSQPESPEVTAWGAPDVIGQNCRANFTLCAQVEDPCIDPQKLKIVQAATLARLDRRLDLFQLRMDEGFIRDGHGDLRCGHVYFHNGIQIIDCIEFDARYRCCDIAADIAFLAMDLDNEGFSGFGRRLMAAYAELAADAGLWELLDFYKCYRAMVRVKVNGLRLGDDRLGALDRERLQRQTRRLLDLAVGYAMDFSVPRLWVVCGLPASGKSTLAHALARLTGAQVLQSDQLRKRLGRQAGREEGPVPFGTGLYADDITDQVYAKLINTAAGLLDKRQPVILDATFARRAHRDQACQLARDCGAALVFVECQVPMAILKERLLARENRPGLSDARLRHLPDLVRNQESFNDLAPPTHLPVDTSYPLAMLLERILAHTHARVSELVTRKRRDVG